MRHATISMPCAFFLQNRGARALRNRHGYAFINTVQTLRLVRLVFPTFC